MKPFQDYLREQFEHEHLNESPVQTGLRYSDHLDNGAFNQEEAKNLLDNSKLSQEDILIHSMKLKRVSEPYDKDKIMDYFISKQPMIESYFIYKVDVDNNCYMLGVWNYLMSRGLARELFYKYYLPKFRSITSDSQQSTQGERYWKALISRAKADNKRVTVISPLGEHDIEYVDAYWGDLKSFADYKIRIYN